jgi:hypothetical protein
MSQTTTPGGTNRREQSSVQHDRLLDPEAAPRTTQAQHERRRGVAVATGALLGLLSLLLLAAGGWALWKDRADRDDAGFVTFGAAELHTGQYAIVGDLQGPGPDWFYGSSVLGDERIRATSQATQPLFLGIARKEDVLRYLGGAGYATIYSFDVRPDTTHPGAAPTDSPSSESIWAESRQGTGRQELRWTPRPGEWSVVFMNADGSSGVSVRGDAAATLPPTPWFAGAALAVGALAGVTGAWAVAHAIRIPKR